jgi:hypothetical protein
MLSVLKSRLETKTLEFISNTQFGFRKGCGTREALGMMRTLCERNLEHGNVINVCFIDFEKAFDRVNWPKMMEVLKDIGIDWRDRRLIMRLYLEQNARVVLGEESTDSCEIGRGVRQGCLISPMLFSIYAEKMMTEVLGEVEEGIKVGGKLLSDIRFADDQAMVAGTEEGLQRMMLVMNEVAIRYGMKINIKKTKAMRISRKGGGRLNIMIEGKQVEQVKRFKYLGALITEDGRCVEEIRSRIGMAKNAFNKRRELITKNINRQLKKRIVKTLIWSVLLYGSETWTLRKEDIKRLEAFEMWVWRRMEKISWTERKTNEEVLHIVGERKCLVEMITKRKKNWIGHVIRGEGILKEVIEGRMEGKRTRGRKRMGMLDILTDGNYVEMKEKAKDRSAWRKWMPRTCQQAEN